MNKVELQQALTDAEAELRAAEEKVSNIRTELYKTVEAERKAEEKAHRGTRIEQVQTSQGIRFVIARGPYLERPKYFQMYVDGRPCFSKVGIRYEMLGAVETALAEIRAAEKEIRDVRKTNVAGGKS